MQIRQASPPIRLIIAAVALVFVGGLSVSATSPPRQQPERSAGMLVSVDFRALTDDGIPVLDLKAEDIVLKVNGHTRALETLSLLDSGDGRTITAGTAAPTLSPPFATNRFSESGRGMLLVVDDASIAPAREPALKEAIARLIDGLAARDRVGLFLLPHGAAINLTVDHAAIRKQATRIVGHMVSDEAATDSACRTRVNIEALKEIFADFSSGSPTTLVFFTNGMSPPATDGASRMKQPTVGPCEIRIQDYDELAKALSASRLDVHVVQILDEVTSGVATTSDLTAGLENLAGLTGNQMLRLTGNESVFARVARETSAYYVVGFDADPSERNGSPQRLEISTSRPNVRVSVRQRVTFPRADGRPLDGSAPPKARDMLATGRAYRDLPLVAASFFSRHNTADKVKVVVMFDTSDPKAALASAMVGLFDLKGKLAAQWTAEVADLSHAPVLAALTAPPGTYRLRVTATDGAGRGGTVDDELKLELAAAGILKMSGLVLGVPVGNGFSPSLMFENETSAVAYLEIYGAAKTAPLSVTMELADAEASKPLVSGNATVAAGEEGFRTAFGLLPIGDLPAGDYLIRARVHLDGKPVGQVTRTLHKGRPG